MKFVDHFPGANSPLYRKINFEINLGEHAVITGASGCDKNHNCQYVP